nr:uncharacterized protein LOC113692084 [Coffea arabica]
MVNTQGDRIAELEGTVVDEMAWAETARDKLQRARARLTRICEEVRDRASGILADTTMLIDEVMDVMQSPVQKGTEEEWPINQPGAQDRGDDRTLERYLKFAPPKFIGGPDPKLAENWLERMTNIFAALDYTEERKVNFATFQFEGVARTWWDVIRGKWERALTPWTWENFTREFNEKFLPPLIQEKREDEFIKLRQGTFSVAEYEGKFIKLSKYAPELVTKERKIIRRFVQGFNVEIQEGLAVAQIYTFTEALEKAQRVESARLQVRDLHTKKRNISSYTSRQASKSVPPSKMGRGMGGVRTAGARKGALSRGGRSGQDQSRGIPFSGPVVTPQVSCGYYGKSNHSNTDCWRKSGKCLFEHQLASCSSKPKVGGSTQRPEKSASKQTSTRGNRPKVPVRVYALDYQQIPDAIEVVEGMDWLARYHAQLNSKTKTVELCIPREATQKLDVRGRLTSSALISGIRARQMLSKGGQEYLVFLINTPSDKVRLEDMPVVKEYPDVFPEELESLPPEKEIAFKIDVTSGVAPISKTPCRIYHSEAL